MHPRSFPTLFYCVHIFRFHYRAIYDAVLLPDDKSNLSDTGIVPTAGDHNGSRSLSGIVLIYTGVISCFHPVRVTMAVAVPTDWLSCPILSSRFIYSFRIPQFVHKKKGEEGIYNTFYSTIAFKYFSIFSIDGSELSISFVRTLDN